MFLKHTLLYNDDKLKKWREMEVINKLQIIDNFRLNGNKSYRKKRFREAI